MPDAVPVAQKENSHYTYHRYNDALAQAEFYFHYLSISIYFYVIRWPETSNQATFLRPLDKILLYMMQCNTGLLKFICSFSVRRNIVIFHKRHRLTREML